MQVVLISLPQVNSYLGGPIDPLHNALIALGLDP